MELLTLQECYLRRGDQIYKESSLIPFFVALGSFGIAAWILFMYSKGDAPLFIAIVPGGGLTLFGLFFLHIFRKSFSKNNWCVAIKPEGVLLIKFRSHLNELLPATDKQLVSLNLNEIDSVGVTKQTQKSDARHGTRVQYLTFLDIHTTGNDLGPLAERLQYEIQVKSKTKYHAYPVSVHGKAIRIQWRSGEIRLTPGIGNIVANLARKGMKILPKQHEKIDLRAQAVRNRKSQEADIIQMLQRGDKIGAVRLAKKLYDFDLAEAKEFVDQLVGSAPSE